MSELRYAWAVEDVSDKPVTIEVFLERSEAMAHMLSIVAGPSEYRGIYRVVRYVPEDE